jgi:hypothetical protein
MNEQSSEKRVLALDVHPRSFGFVVFEGPNRMLDWGIRSFRPGVNAVKIPAAKKLLALFDEFTPSAVVIRKPETRRSTKMLSMILRRANSRRIPVRFISRRDVNRAFVGFEANKYEVASALAKQFPALISKLPPKRKCWQSEDYRMGISMRLRWRRVFYPALAPSAPQCCFDWTCAARFVKHHFCFRTPDYNATTTKSAIHLKANQTSLQPPN